MLAHRPEPRNRKGILHLEQPDARRTLRVTQLPLLQPTLAHDQQHLVPRD